MPHAVGTGAYHVGVEVYDKEWSFRRTGDGSSGVFSREPGECEEHCCREAERMGRTELSQREVDALLRELANSWPGSGFNLLRRNSGHFCDELCNKLGVGPVPEWAMSLAGKGAALDEQLQQVTENARAVASTLAARANEFDERYQIRNTADAHVQNLRAKTKELDARFGITDKAANVAAKAQGLAVHAAANTCSAIRSGKEARGATESDNYQFGDLTRGIVQSALKRGHANGSDGGGRELADAARGPLRGTPVNSAGTAEAAPEAAGRGG